MTTELKLFIPAFWTALVEGKLYLYYLSFFIYENILFSTATS